MNSERIVEVTPAWDRRHDDPKQNYGIGGCDLRFIYRVGNRAVQFVMATGWFLPHVQDITRKWASYPAAHDIGYHSPVPMHEGQEPIHDNCPYTGGVCYYDGGTLAAQRFMDCLIAEGHEALWKMLENQFEETFGEVKE